MLCICDWRIHIAMPADSGLQAASMSAVEILYICPDLGNDNLYKALTFADTSCSFAIRIDFPA